MEKNQKELSFKFINSKHIDVSPRYDNNLFFYIDYSSPQEVGNNILRLSNFNASFKPELDIQLK